MSSLPSTDRRPLTAADAAAIRADLDRTLAAGSQAGYRRDWGAIVESCDSRGAAPLPAAPELVAAYLAHLGSATYPRRVRQPDGTVTERAVRYAMATIRRRADTVRRPGAGQEADSRYAAHSLRRGFVTQALRNQVPIHKVREASRHATLTSLQTYTTPPNATSTPPADTSACDYLAWDTRAGCPPTESPAPQRTVTGYPSRGKVVAHL